MSTATLPGSPPSTTPRPLLWTCAEFHRVGDMGVFEGRRAMLIRGVILEQGQMSPPYAIALELTHEVLRAAFGPEWVIRGQMPLVLGPATDPKPDLAVIPGRPRDRRTHPTTAQFVVEVADTSLKFDTTDKAELYATAGIEDYWVLDLNSGQLLVFRDPAGNAYQTQTVLGPNDRIAPLAAPHAVVTVADLLPWHGRPSPGPYGQ